MTVERLDDGIYRAEKAAVAAMLLVMGLAVFLDVVHRVSTRADSWAASPVFLAVAGSVVAGLAFHTRGDPQPWARGLAAGVGLAVARVGFLWALPNGLIWSQTLALALTLWLGNLGASLAAHDRRHLAMDVGSKLWPEAWRGRVAATGHAVTAVFCLGILGLAVRSVGAHWDLWTSTDGAAGNLSGLAIPKWVPALSIVYGMVLLAFRFGLDAWRAWTGRLADDGDEVLHQLGLAAPEDAP